MNEGMVFSAYAAYGFLLVILFFVYWQVRKTSKESEKILLVSFSISAVFLILTYVLLLIVKTSFTPPLIPVGSIDAWIGFSGSILGGTITVFALVFTINNEKKLREKEYEIQQRILKEENSQRLMPVIEIAPQRKNEEMFSSKVHGTDGLSYQFIITNVSENHAREIDIQAIAYEAYYDKASKIDLTKELFSKTKSIKILSSNRSSEFYIGLCSNKMDGLFPEVFDQFEVRISLTIKVTLYDIHKIAPHTFITRIYGTLHENIYDPVTIWPGEYGEEDLELYNKFDLHVHTCLTDIE